MRREDKLSDAKMKMGFMPDATLDDLMTVARRDAEHLRELNDLIDRIAGGEFSAGHVEWRIESAGMIRKGEVIWEELA